MREGEVKTDLDRFPFGFAATLPDPVVEPEEVVLRVARLKPGNGLLGQDVADSGQGLGGLGLDLVGVFRAVEDLCDGVADDVAGASDVTAVVDVHDAVGNLKLE